MQPSKGILIGYQRFSFLSLRLYIVLLNSYTVTRISYAPGLGVLYIGLSVRLKNMRVKGRVFYNTVPNLFSVVVYLVANALLIAARCTNAKKERLPSRSARRFHYIV